MYEIIFSERAREDIEGLDKPIQERIINAIERMRFKPEHFISKLVDDPGYKMRVGDYRVIMDIDKTNLAIHITKIGHRKSVYK